MGKLAYGVIWSTSTPKTSRCHMHPHRSLRPSTDRHVRPAWNTKVWIPFFLATKLEIDHTPFTAASYHLGSVAKGGHYCTAVLEGGFWWIYIAGKEQVNFSLLPLIWQEDCCLLWLNWKPHRKAESISQLPEESPILTDQEKMHTIIHDPSIKDNWHSQWLPALDCLDTSISVDQPGHWHHPVINAPCTEAGLEISTVTWEWHIVHCWRHTPLK